MPVGSCTLLVLLEVLFRREIDRVSLDLMEWANLESLKDTARNTWQHLAVTAAMVLTVAAAMFQKEPIKAAFTEPEDSEDTLGNVQSAYYIHCGFSMLYCLTVVLQCVIYLCYAQPLCNKDAIKFFIANPACIGGPVLSMIFGSLNCMIAMLMWVVGTSGIVHAAVLGFFTCIMTGVLIAEVYDKGSFDPSGESKKSREWKWTHMDRDEWPWFVTCAKDEKAIRIFRKFGDAIKDDVNQHVVDNDNFEQEPASVAGARVAQL